MKLKTFFTYCIGIVVKPKKTILLLSKEENYVYLFLSFSLTLFLYSVTSFVAYGSGILPTIKPFIPLIPEKEYYLWQFFFGIISYQYLLVALYKISFWQFLSIPVVFFFSIWLFAFIGIKLCYFLNKKDIKFKSLFIPYFFIFSVLQIPLILPREMFIVTTYNYIGSFKLLGSIWETVYQSSYLCYLSTLVWIVLLLLISIKEICKSSLIKSAFILICSLLPTIILSGIFFKFF